MPQVRQCQLSAEVEASAICCQINGFRSIDVWKRSCTEWGMLRITISTTRHSGVFILEGRLTGLWGKELLRVSRTANSGYDNIFDLQQVFYVDPRGEEALLLLGERGAHFIADSRYGRELCHRLNLQRVEPTLEQESAEGRKGSGKRPRRRTGRAGRPNATAAGAKQPVPQIAE